MPSYPVWPLTHNTSSSSRLEPLIYNFSSLSSSLLPLNYNYFIESLLKPLYGMSFDGDPASFISSEISKRLNWPLSLAFRLPIFSALSDQILLGFGVLCASCSATVAAGRGGLASLGARATSKRICYSLSPSSLISVLVGRKRHPNPT